MPTRRDVINRAFRFLGVVAEDESMTADQEAFAGVLLDSVYDEISDETPPDFTIEDIPAISATHMAMLLAADLAPSYSRPPPISRGKAMLRLMGSIRPDNRAEITEPEYY